MRLTLLLSEQEIQAKVSDMAARVSADYKDSHLVLIGVLNGAFVFLADIARRIDVPSAIDFVGVKSYGANDTSSGKPQLTKPLELDIKNKDVLLVEDIVDSGLTIAFLIKYLQSFSPRSIEVCAVIDKAERRQTPVSVKYACHRVDKGFLVGYGLDYDEKYRSLPGIYTLKL